jgi:hypothetical protein
MKTQVKYLQFTAIIVISFQALLFLSLNIMAAEQKILIIEKSADDKDNTNHAANANNPPPGTTNTYEVSSLADCATQIANGLQEGDCIKELNFRGHGGSGNQSVGGGVNVDGDKEIDTGGEEWKEALKGLKGKFCEGATINLWGCNVGAGEPGANKLKQIADYFGVTVKGTVNTVYAGQQNTYDGPIQTAEPNKPKPMALAPTDEEKAPKKGAEGVIPTLTEWGVIILLILTMATGTFYILSGKTQVSYVNK